MAYEHTIYEKVKAQLEERRAHALFERQRRLEKAYAACPSLRDIDEELQSCGAAATTMILSHPEHAEDLAQQLRTQLDVLMRQRAEALRLSGFLADYTDVKYQCAACEDTGYVEGRQCSCMRRALAEESCRASSLSVLFDSQNFDSFDFGYYGNTVDEGEGASPRERMESIYQVCKGFVEHFDSEPDSLFFYGGAGLGKTFLSTSIARELLTRGKSVVYQSAAALFSLYMDYTFGRVDASSAKPQLDSLASCDLLIIDDLGTEAISSYSTAYLFEILNERILHGKKMVISTNLNVSEIASIYSERIHSRLLEHFILLKFIGSDIRLQKMLTK